MKYHSFIYFICWFSEAATLFCNILLRFINTSIHNFNFGFQGSSTPKPLEKTSSRALTTIDGELVSSMIPKEATSVVRVTLANIEEANILLQNGLDFYGATFFPTELATPAQAAKLIKPSRYFQYLNC